MRLTGCSILVASVLAATAGCFVSSSDDDGVVDTGSTMTVANRSDYTLTEVHLASNLDSSWGPDLLNDVLYPGEDLVMTDIDCGTYDVLVVDDTGSPCTLTNIDLCVSSDVWVIDNVTLDTCAFNPRKTPGTSSRPSQTDATATTAASSI
jgi:hypothetical protein